MSNPSSPTVPNHHAHYPGFTGLGGWVAATSMLFGRSSHARLAADLTAVAGGDVVVDIGCGPGAATREAARRGATVIGVDPAAVMLRVARVVNRRTPDITWVEGTAEALPAPDECATVVWALATVHHWADIAQALTEVRRVLQPGGRLLAIERLVRADANGLASHGWSEAQAEAFAVACRQAGFTDVAVTTHASDRGTELAVRARRP